MSSFLLICVLSAVLYLIGATLSLYKIHHLKKEGYDGLNYQDCLNPVLWFSFVYGTLWNWFVPQHVMEQLLLRYYDSFCKPNCYDSATGKCVHCGCNAVAKASVPFASCSADNWGPIIFNKKMYQQMREKYPITIKIEYNEKAV